MSRREIVLLVSRAIALLQFITAFMTVIFLPQSALLMVQAARLQAFSNVHLHGPAVATIPMWTNFVEAILRIVILVVIGALFWKCGPTVERLLLPVQAAPEQ